MILDRIRLERRAAATIVAYAVSTVMLLWVAIANGFPMLFSDSGTYLRIGTELYAPPDRPPTYGLAIFPFYKLFGLWAVVAAQALFTTWLLDRVLRVLTGRHSPIALVATVAALAGFTSLPWFVGQIMPDMFAGLVILLGYVLIFGWNSLARWERRCLPALLALVIAFHLSFVPILGAVVVLAALLGWRMTRSRQPLRTGGIIVAILATVMLGFSTLNLLAYGRFTSSMQSSTFLLTRFLDGGVAQPTIAESCAHEKLLLCRLHKIFDPAYPYAGAAYMWSAHPEFSAEEARRIPDEEALIIRRTITGHPGSVIRMAVTGFGRMMVVAGAGDGLVAYGPEKQIYRQVTIHFPNEAPAWFASRQQQGTLPALLVMPDRAIGLIAGLMTIAVLAYAVRRREPELAGLALMTILALIFNALFCSFLSGVFERLQARMMWMPLFVLAATVTWYCSPRAANDRR